jgi:hypothetical protein
MSWLYSQALVEEYLGANSLDGEQSVPSSGSPTPQAYLSPDKMTDFSRLSRFGMTFKPLTENLGEELLTLYLEDFHAKTFPQQEKEQESMENASGMWREMARIIHEVRPRYVFVENSPMLTSRGLGRVLGDLAAMGFDARWGVLGAADVGANHQRDRIWIVAKWRGQLPHAQHDRIRWWEQQQESIEKENWAIEPDVGRVANGVAARVDRLKAIGNGQVPLCAATAWQILSKDI